jgi:CheY-like chemotaxis protein
MHVSTLRLLADGDGPDAIQSGAKSVVTLANSHAPGSIGAARGTRYPISTSRSLRHASCGAGPTASSSAVDNWHASCRLTGRSTLEGAGAAMDEYEKKHVLLVEDNARLRDTVRESLRWQGYRVDEAADGAEALAVAAVARPDVIVTDLNMPVMDGAAFIQRCRALPGLDQVPIIVMFGAERDSLDCLTAAQVSAYLVKPFDLVELTTAIERRANS